MELTRLLVAGLLLATITPAESRFDNAIFEVPRGWRCEERPDALVLVAPEAESLPTVTIRLTRSREGRDSLGGLFTSAVRGSVRNSRILYMGRTETIHAQHGFAMKMIRVHVKRNDGNVLYQTFVGANPNGRFEFVEYTAPNELLHAKYRPALSEFLQVLTFATAIDY